MECGHQHAFSEFDPVLLPAFSGLINLVQKRDDGVAAGHDVFQTKPVQRIINRVVNPPVDAVLPAAPGGKPVIRLMHEMRPGRRRGDFGRLYFQFPAPPLFTPDKRRFFLFLPECHKTSSINSRRASLNRRFTSPSNTNCPWLSRCTWESMT
jgi:hypothetical protein